MTKAPQSQPLERLRLRDRVRWQVLDAYLRLLARSQRPILLGPWRSEVGFEVLYWLPFLAWVVEHYGLNPARLIVVSRGGAAAWYPAEALKLELYELVPLEACRIAQRLEHAETGLLKQTRITAFDREVYQAVVKTTHTKPWWLHPAWMYQTFAPWWEERAGLGYVGARTLYKPLPVGEVPASWQLPPQFVAARFYARPTFPMSAVTIDFVRQWAEALAKHVPIVVLNPRVHVDDHVDFKIVGPNISILPPVEPRENLALTAAVLKKANGFIGTYGGFAQLALRLGVPSLSIYETWHYTAPMHKALSELVALKSGVGFQVMDLKNVAYWRAMLAGGC